MGFALGTATVLALTMTVAMGVITWRLVREERRRSAARLAALAAELRRRQAAPAGPLPADRLPEVETAAASLVDVTIPGPEPTPARTSRSDLVAHLFDTPDQDADGWSRRLAGLGAAAFVLVVAISAALLGTSAGSREELAGPTDQVPVELHGVGARASGRPVGHFGGGSEPARGQVGHACRRPGDGV